MKNEYTIGLDLSDKSIEVCVISKRQKLHPVDAGCVMDYNDLHER
jgi:hypothetical protein